MFLLFFWEWRIILKIIFYLRFNVEKPRGENISLFSQQFLNLKSDFYVYPSLIFPAIPTVFVHSLLYFISTFFYFCKERNILCSLAFEFVFFFSCDMDISHIREGSFKYSSFLCCHDLIFHWESSFLICIWFWEWLFGYFCAIDL